MSTSKSERLAKVHKRAVARFDAIWTTVQDEREQCVQDRRFYSIAGAQWEGALGEQFANVPRFEINKIQLAVLRIFNEYRNNRISVDFRPKDDETSEDVADTLDGLYRADEQDSGAQEAYDNAFEEGVGGGFAAWRLRAEYEDEESEDDERQRIRIEPIFDADTTVFFDLDAKRYDKADAKHAYVLVSMSPDAYEDRFPKHPKPDDFPRPAGPDNFDWFQHDLVWIAEYYEVEEESREIRYFRGLDGQEVKFADEDMTLEQLDTLKATGFEEVRTKTVKRKRVHKYLMNGSEIISDEGRIAGSLIPIVPFYGKRWFVDNVERCQGHVRTSKDAQRLKNMQVSRLGQIAALSPIEKPILVPEQIAGFETYWANDNIKQYPYLLINQITTADGQQLPAGPVGYTKPPSLPPALAACLQITDQDITELLGNQAAGEQLQPNQSGKAVELIQNRLDMQTFIYMDNMSKSMKRCGEIWYSMAKDIYVEENRKMKAVNPQGEADFIEIARPVYDAEKGQTVLENDLASGKMDVITDVGPSFTSRRDGTVRSLTGIMQVMGPASDPEIMNILASTAIMNMDGEGMSDIKDFLRKRLLRMGAAKPTDEEKKELDEEAQNAKPNPNEVYLESAAKAEDAKAAADRANTVLTIAKVEETKAKTLKTYSEVDGSDHARSVEETRLALEVDRNEREAQQPVKPVDS